MKVFVSGCYDMLHSGHVTFFKKALDPGSTNPKVESIMARIAPWADAATLAGAGGGGFLFAFAKSRAAKRKIESVLSCAGNGGRCYRFEVKTGE